MVTNGFVPIFGYRNCGGKGGTDMIKRFWCRLFRHRHSWKVTHTNKWQIPTRKICRKCYCVASVERFEREPRLTYRWVYDYGKGFGRVSGRKDMGGY